MICYSLICSGNHTFDSWFASAEAYSKLKSQGFLSCTICGSLNVEKAIMAPNVLVTSDKSSENKKLKKLSPSPAAKAMAELKNHIEKNSEDVGNNFAVVAREMHDGDTPERNIHGKASLSEAKSLSEDGVPIVPLPWFGGKNN
jgi:hypothetical protein